MNNDDDRKPDVPPLILVVDDEPTQRLLTRDCLEREGYRVAEAADGNSALAMMREEPPAAVLLDLVMPDRDGFSVCAEVRADPVLRHTPIIMVTGLDDAAAVEHSFAVQATDFITKPVLWALLPHRVRFVLRTQAMQNDLRTALEEAGSANRAKSEFLANMSHELRTPLNAILGFSELIRAEIAGPLGSPKYIGYVNDIHASGQHLLGIVNDILDLVRVESNALTLSEADATLEELAADVLQLLGSSPADGDITLVNGIDRAAPIVHGDERRLKQVILNLVSNAVKFTERGGKVELRFEWLPDGRGAVVVSDNGPGIPAEELPRLMQPFQQLDGGLARRHDGAGLGIPIARALARLHGGDLVYESTLGKGTTVRFILPAERLTDSARLRKAIA